MQNLSKVSQSNVTAIAILAVGVAILYGCTSQPNQTYQFQVGDEFRITYRSNKADEFVDKNRLKVNGAIIDFSYKVEDLEDHISVVGYSLPVARNVRRSNFMGDELINSIEINDVPGDNQATITFQYATKEGGQMVAEFNLKGDVFAPVSPKSLRKAVSGILQNGDGCSNAEVLDSEVNQLQFSKNEQPLEVSPLPQGLIKERMLVGDSVKNCQGFIGTTLFYRHDENNQLVWSPHQSRLLWTQQIFEGELQAFRSSVVVPGIQNSKNMFSDDPSRKIVFSRGPLIPGKKISELAFTFSPFIEETKKSNF